MPTPKERDDDNAEREEIEFIKATRDIKVIEQCTLCHCDVEETINGICLNCWQSAR